MKIVMEPLRNHFYAKKVLLGSAGTKHLSGELAMRFTGVVLGLYAVGKNCGIITDFRCAYHDGGE